MSSSGVQPRSCVVHDPDPSGHDDESDTSSDCGSLCTCTSSSMTSIATIDRASERNSAPLVEPPSTSQVVSQTSGVEGDSRYTAVRVPQRTASRRERSRHSDCRRSSVLAASLRHFLLTMSEFFPWLAGFVVIYYSYCWWGMGSGFSAFLFMIGAHAVIRFIKTRGVLSCVPFSSQRHVESDPSSESEDEVEPEQQQQQQRAPAPRQIRAHWSAEKPPSYDVAVVKPPPYDLQYHLTPQQPVGDLPVKLQRRSSEELLIGPSRVAVDGSDRDIFLPSYQDAMKLSQYNVTDEHDRRDGET